jgi:hypothetical protein
MQTSNRDKPSLADEIALPVQYKRLISHSQLFSEALLLTAKPKLPDQVR